MAFEQCNIRRHETCDGVQNQWKEEDCGTERNGNRMGSGIKKHISYSVIKLAFMEFVTGIDA